MSTGVKPTAWSRGRWLFSIGLVFAAHIGLLIAFSGPPQPPRKLAAPMPQVTLLLSEAQNEAWLAETAIQDPTTLALPHPMGFSGSAWNSAVRSDAAPLRWTQETDFLQPSFDTFGESFARLTRSTRTPDEFSAQLRAPSISSKIRGAEPRPETRVILSPSLSDRGLVQAQPPPLIESDESLPDTIVEVQVGRSGAVFTCRVSRREQVPPQGSVVSLAEALALKHARTLRFQSAARSSKGTELPSIRLSAGELRYQWGYAPRDSAPKKQP